MGKGRKVTGIGVGGRTTGVAVGATVACGASGVAVAIGVGTSTVAARAAGDDIVGWGDGTCEPGVGSSEGVLFDAGADGPGPMALVCSGVRRWSCSGWEQPTETNRAPTARAAAKTALIV